MSLPNTQHAVTSTPITHQQIITLSESMTSTLIQAIASCVVELKHFTRSTWTSEPLLSVDVATNTTELIKYVHVISQNYYNTHVGIFVKPELTAAAGSSVLLDATFSVLMANGTAVNQHQFTKLFSSSIDWGFEKFVEREWVLHTPHVLHNDSLLIRVDLLQTVYAAKSQQLLTPQIDDSYTGNVNMMFNWTVCNLAQLSRAPGQVYVTDWFPSNTKLPTFFLQMYPMGHSVEHEGYVSISCCGYGMSPLVFRTISCSQRYIFYY
jgi:hypothetical protein